MSPHLNIDAMRKPAAFRAEVQAIGECGNSAGPFVILSLRVGEAAFEMFLPPHSYQVARSIADLWPKMIERPGACRPLSAEALAAIRVPATEGAAS